MRLLTVAGALSVLLGAAIGVRAAPAANPEAAQLSVIEAVNADEVNFGGVYVDKDGTLGIQYVGGNAGRAAVERTVTAGVAVRWEKVEHSRSELKQITAKIKALDLEEVVSISAGTSRNEVIVTVGPKGSVTDVSSALSGFGSAVVVEQSDDIPLIQTCSNRLSCTLWRGGIAIFRNDTNAACTWGFQASRNGNLNMITAGHCQLTNGKFNHGGVTIGSNGVARNSINPATFDGLDVERTRVDGPYFPTESFGQNVLYADDNHMKWSMTSVRSSTGYAVGQNVAKSGIRTGYTIGYLSDTDYSYKLVPAQAGGLIYYPNCSAQSLNDCPTVWGMVAGVTVDEGDSGGPVFNWAPVSPSMQHTFLGTESAGGQSTMVFVPAYAAAAELTLDFWCTTTGCP